MLEGQYGVRLNNLNLYLSAFLFSFSLIVFSFSEYDSIILVLNALKFQYKNYPETAFPHFFQPLLAILTSSFYLRPQSIFQGILYKLFFPRGQCYSFLYQSTII